MKPLKILIDCHVFDQTLQGTTTYILGLYKEMIKDKSKIFYFISHHYDLQKEFGIQENIIYLKYKSTNKFYRLLFELPAVIGENNIDYAHFQYIVPPIKRCKYIVTLHDVLFLDYPKYFPFFYKISKNILYRLSANYSDIVLTVSQFSKNRIHHHFNIAKSYITPNAIDAAFYEDYDKNVVQLHAKNKFNIENYFLFVSRWEPRKNHQLLLQVFVDSGFYNNYNLVFVGEDAIPNKEFDLLYNSLSEEIKSKIFKFKNISFHDLLLLNRAATLSIYPSVAEGFGIPPLESVAANVPTICSNTTAMSDFEFIAEGFFNPLDAKDLAQKIYLMLQSKSTLEKKEKLLKKYNWQTSANCLQFALQENLKKETYNSN
jgi:glycosyltransferase involved in cell wall biosynthesis